ncbi:hypothetical protein F4820DRAFT_212991 [Hypoxylon rubiginosum]|uniref:Uncharacterized protein n=1 Tax=Hypoxylon rubiginosum TaxID=110542 RepID=A0ACB9Z7B7_9PEZI|nr:hypothetical protein F4820DRAFT_212991 [Hypoxylon rubiginosum]
MAPQQTQQPGEPSTPQLQQQQQLPYHGTSPFVHNVALGVTPIALLALFLPPRRLDLRLGILGGVALWGTNQLARDYTGTSTLHRIGRRLGALVPSGDLPDRAKETRDRLRVERANKLLQQQQLQQQLRQQEAAGSLPEEQRRLVEEQRRKLARLKEEEEEERGILERVWMGDSGEDWKEKRDRREKEALSEGGGGYWGLITDQISEVWNMGKKKDEGEGEKREKGGSDGEPTKRS